MAIGLNQLESRRKETDPGALAGTQLGAYEVLESVGKGGMGEIYRGFQPGLDRAVAIKVLPHHLADQPEFRVRFEREARIVSTLHHPNIVHVFDFGRLNSVTYMVMDYVEGKTLDQAIKEGKRLPLQVARPIVHDIAAALDYAHSRGLVHRDVKPSNVILQTTQGISPKAILTDFGIAKILDAHTQITGTGVVGTLDYLAPEQIQSARTVDHRADIYALGVITYQMLTGELPFRGGSGQVLFGHLYQPPPDPRQHVPGLSANVAHAVMRAMAKDPDVRFNSAAKFAAALAE